MLFNSIAFVFFLPIVFFLYWFVVNKKLRVQNLFIVVASYFFYAWWDWRFLGILIFSSLVDFSIGILLDRKKEQSGRKMILMVSVLVNLGLLGFFKYFNFFIESFVSLSESLGFQANVTTLSIIFPIGISFYTFQSLSYTIEVYNGRIKPTRDLVSFLAYVSFFPQLVAGPIGRPKNLLPQFFQRRIFDKGKAVDGVRQILWGLFKKVVVADNCAGFVNDIFAHHETYSSLTLLLGCSLFAIQMYGDFSGYSDIAIGTARLFGFDLMRNFAYPYFSRGVVEFWKRWHISLTSWFRDYVYYPLGGSYGSTLKTIRNVFIVLLLSGFWHGAKWNFIAWGFLNAVYFLPNLLMKKKQTATEIVAHGNLLPRPVELLQMLSTFLLVAISLIFFRAPTIADAGEYFRGLFSFSSFRLDITLPYEIIFFILLLFGMEWIQRENQHGLYMSDKRWPFVLRWFLYFSIAFMIGMYFGTNISFFYFYF